MSRCAITVRSGVFATVSYKVTACWVINRRFGGSISLHLRR